MATIIWIILRAIGFDLIACHTKRCRDELHGGDALLGGQALQNLNVLERLLSCLRRRRRVRSLARRKWNAESGQSKSKHWCCIALKEKVCIPFSWSSHESFL